MPRVAIDTTTFEAASVVFGQRLTGRLSSIIDTLLRGLSGTGAMAGSDQAATTWAASYDGASRLAVETMTDLGNACYSLAGLLQQTGFNHASAESASTPGAGHAAADRTRYSDQSMLCYASPPTGAGGSSAPPTGWGLIEHLVGYAWPNGHQDRLHAAASAWTGAADALDGAAYYPIEAYAAIAGQRSPEVDDAMRVCSGMQAHVTDLAAACRQLAAGCTDLASHIDTAHSQIEGELVNLLEWTAGIEAGGLLVGLFTFGGGDVAAQSFEAGRVAMTARRIATVIEALIRAASTVAESIGTVLTRIGTVVERIKPLLGARASAVVVREAGALPTITRGAEEAAVDGLTASAEEDAATDAMYARYTKGKQAKGETPLARDAWARKLEVLRRNKAVGDAYRDQVADELGIVPGESGWATEVPVKGLGRRFDIANPTEQIAFEVKSGSTPVGDGLAQLGKDESAVRQGWTITWQLKQGLDPRLMARLQELAARYPGRFSYDVAGG